MRDLLEIYNLIVDEKALFKDYLEFMQRLSISAIEPEQHLEMLKNQRKEQKK